MIYKDYIKKLSVQAHRILNDLEATYNFELGEEFEIAICELLRKLLPEKYGVCRGFVVTHDNQEAGDDIIIYDRYRFPTLRLLDQSSFDKKQRIPVEAVYAYFEAKHSLIFSGKKENFKKALSQVNKVKELVEQREVVDIRTACDPYVEMEHLSITSGRENWPEKMNPMFTGIFSLKVRDEKGKIVVDRDETKRILGSIPKKWFLDIEFPPDLIIVNPYSVMLPAVISQDETGKHLKYHSPFSTKTTTMFTEITSEEYGGLATGLCSLLYALDVIRLGRMPWPKIISGFIDTK